MAATGPRAGERLAPTCLALLALLMLLLIPVDRDPDYPNPPDGLISAAELLRGDAPRADVATDVVGARALVFGHETYPLLGPALEEIGLDWPLMHTSTHPPTSYVFLLPFARTSWERASVIWSWVMLVVFLLALSLFGVPKRWLAPGLVGVLLWPPAAWSVGQTTPLILLGTAMASRYRSRPFAAGAGVALGAAVKIVPAVLILPLLGRRENRLPALAGALLVGCALLAVAVALNPSVVFEYLTVATSTSRDIVSRTDNGGLLALGMSAMGPAGAGVAVALVAAVLLLQRGSWPAWAWASVALMPIAWVYSLLPLLPALGHVALHGSLVGRALAVAAFTLPFLVDPFGPRGAAMVTECIVLCGIAVVVPSRARSAVASEVQQRQDGAVQG